MSLPASSEGNANGASPDSFAVANDTKFSEKDWYEKVYQGDQQKQLTLRAVLMGGCLGMLMSMANLYTTLKIGWAFGVSITACVLSYTIWNLLRAVSGGRISKMSVLENNCMQSTASAAGYSTGATVATAFGALLLLEGHHQPWLILGSFTLFTALMGVLMAVPLKRQMVNREKLPFPTGLASAVTLRSLYSEGREAVAKARALIAALGAGIVVGILKAPEGAIHVLDRVLNKIHLRLPDLVPAAGYFQVNGRQMIAFGFDPSVLLIGAGMLIGLRVCLSMLAGSLLLYTVVGPWLISLDAANAGVAGYTLSIPLVGGGTVYHLTRWALWGGTAVMVFASLTTFALDWETVGRAFKTLSGRKPADEGATMTAIEVPLRWLIVGLIPVSIGLLLVQYFAFQINLWLGLVAVILAFFLGVVASRATGETDTTPLGALGKLVQLIYAVLSPGNTTHNLMAASAAANSAMASADLLTDLKSGYMLGANPRRQFWAQFIGIFFGTLAIVPAWYLMVPNKQVLEAYNPPMTNMWKAVAEVLSGGGLEMLPTSAKVAVVFGALLGTAIPLLNRFAPKLRPWLPSAMGLGLSWVITYNNCQAMALGSLLVWAWGKWSKRNADTYAIPVASGLIAGESLAAASIAILATLLGMFGLQG